MTTNERVDAAAAKLLVELAFLVPKGTDLSTHPVAKALEEYKWALEAREEGSVLLSAVDARCVAWLLARAIREDVEACEGDRLEARKLLARLGGDTQ